MSSRSHYFRSTGFFIIVVLHMIALLLLLIGNWFDAPKDTRMYEFFNHTIWYLFGLVEPIIYFSLRLIDLNQKEE